jgi:hypothetical protein
MARGLKEKEKKVWRVYRAAGTAQQWQEQAKDLECEEREMNP